MRYHIFYRGISANSLLNLNEDSLNVVVNAYLEGKGSFTIAGHKYTWPRLNYFKIYANKINWDTEKIIERARENSGWITGPNSYATEKFISSISSDETEKKIGNAEFGSNINRAEQTVYPTDNYVHRSRIEELKSTTSKFDLSKLIQLCEELNSNYGANNYYSVGMLGRAIIDHVPPIFGCKTFSEVANNHGTKSVKGNLQHLNQSMRNISDGMLHSHIRLKESFPNSNQVNFSQDLDVLLGEILNVLR